MWAGLRALFRVPTAKKVAPRPKLKTVLPPSERAALLKQAISAHRAGRSHVRNVLESQLDELRAKVPKPSRDPKATERLLSLHQADGALKRLMTSDLKRFLALVRIRELLEAQGPDKRPRAPVPKR
ncbi:MAG: hypothetical protein AB7E79_05465 [Rhodospirillaceae bacterium]